MRLNFPQNNQENPEYFLRRAGYAYIRDRKSGQESYVRRLGRDFYPRFHVYCEERNGQVQINLHLDQKAASYQGSARHSAEYESEPVKQEIFRLQQLLEKVNCNEEVNNKQADDFEKLNFFQKFLNIFK